MDPIQFRFGFRRHFEIAPLVARTHTPNNGRNSKPVYRFRIFVFGILADA